jgi:hypothetical protein
LGEVPLVVVQDLLAGVTRRSRSANPAACSAARIGILSAALAIGGVVPTVLGGPVVDRLP